MVCRCFKFFSENAPINQRKSWILGFEPRTPYFPDNFEPTFGMVHAQNECKECHETMKQGCTGKNGQRTRRGSDFQGN